MTLDVIEDHKLRASGLGIPDESCNSLAGGAERVAPIRGIEAYLADVIVEAAVPVHEDSKLDVATLKMRMIAEATEVRIVCVCSTR